MRATAGYFWVLLTLAAYSFSTTNIVQCQQQLQQHQAEQQQPQRHSYAASRAGRNGAAVIRYNRTAASTPGTCECKDLLTNLHDRVGVLVSLDESQRRHLDAIDKKIVQFEESNLASLDSIGVQQTGANKRLDVLEHLQRENNRRLEELKGEFLLLQQQQQHQLEKAAGGANEIGITRVVRQANSTDSYSSADPNSHGLRLDCSAKLDALSIWLTSTRLSINQLHMQLAENLTRLTQTTSNLQRRFSNFARRQQVPPGAQAYLPVQPSLCPSLGGNARPQEAVCSYAQPGDSLGLQRLQLAGNSAPFFVACDDKVQGGGWIVIQSRYNGDTNFQRDWLEYKTGFGNLAGEFFIGLEKLHAITTSTLHELLILMADVDGVQRYARYSSFAIGDEKELYALNLLGAYSGDAGDSLSYQAGSKFSTFDNDNDGWLEGNCALAHTGAWWYNACEKSNLNGQYLSGEYDNGQIFQGMYWQDFRGPTYSLKSVRMMIRPVGSDQEQRR